MSHGDKISRMTNDHCFYAAYAIKTFSSHNINSVNKVSNFNIPKSTRISFISFSFDMTAFVLLEFPNSFVIDAKQHSSIFALAKFMMSVRPQLFLMPRLCAPSWQYVTQWFTKLLHLHEFCVPLNSHTFDRLRQVIPKRIEISHSFGNSLGSCLKAQIPILVESMVVMCLRYTGCTN